MPDQSRDPNELGALWVRVSQKGARFMTGKVNGVDVVVFENKNKRGNAPDWRVFKSQSRKERAQRPQEQDDDLWQ